MDAQMCKHCIHFIKNGCYKDYGTIYYSEIVKICMGNCNIDNHLKNELNACHNENYTTLTNP